MRYKQIESLEMISPRANREQIQFCSSIGQNTGLEAILATFSPAIRRQFGGEVLRVDE
jgi:hypothetical protein